MSVKGFWWRVPADTPVAEKPWVNWPYWHDDDDGTDDGLTDWSHRPAYCNGSFWDGLRRAFDGIYQPCGCVRPGGAAILDLHPAVMDCCICPDMPWTWDLVFANLQDYPGKVLRSGSLRLYYDRPTQPPCVWVSDTSPAGLGGGVASDNLSITKVDADGNIEWSAQLLQGNTIFWDCGDSFDLVADMGWLDNYGEATGSAVLTRVDHSGGCGGPFDQLITDDGDLLTTDDDEALVT